MVSKRQKVVAIGIVAIIILASVTILFQIRPKEPSPAKQIMLQEGEIGPGWTAGKGGPDSMDYANKTSSYFLELENSTLRMAIDIDVFNSSNDSHYTFLGLLPYLFDHHNTTLGDEAVYQTVGPSDFIVFFVRSNVMVTLDTQAKDLPRLSWQQNATLAIAEMQLQKIDRYLIV